MAKKAVPAKKTVAKKAVKKAVVKKAVTKKTVIKKAKPAVKVVAKKVVKKTTKSSVPKKVVKKAAKVVAVKKVVKKAMEQKPKKVAAAKTPEKKVVKAPVAVKPKAVQKKSIVFDQPPPKVVKRPTTIRYGKADLEHFKKLILAKQSEILEQLQNLRDQVLDPTTGEYINENSPYSLHMAEQGTDAMEREKIYLYAQRENKFLGYLEDALKRIEAGTYGLCIDCIDEPKHLCKTCPLIPKERLEAVPHSQLCVEIKNKQEKQKR